MCRYLSKVIQQQQQQSRTSREGGLKFVPTHIHESLGSGKDGRDELATDIDHMIGELFGLGSQNLGGKSKLTKLFEEL